METKAEAGTPVRSRVAAAERVCNLEYIFRIYPIEFSGGQDVEYKEREELRIT